jgi:hypothetical protein
MVLPGDVVTFLVGLVRDARGELPDSASDLGEWILADGRRAEELLAKYAPQALEAAAPEGL